MEMLPFVTFNFTYLSQGEIFTKNALQVFMMTCDLCE